MGKVVIVVVSSILSYLITRVFGLNTNNSLIVFALINSIIALLAMFFLDKKRSDKEDKGNTVDRSSNYMDDAELKNHLKRILSNAIHLNDALENIKAGASEGEKAAEQIALNTQEIVEHTTEQLDIVDKTTFNSKEIAEIISSASEFASSANQAAQTSASISNDAGKAVKKAVETMKDIEKTTSQTSHKINTLAEKSQRIGDIISVITSIASQTNLLALNAAIEAARAGEHGRGFAVVADEVRKLAEESNTAATEISEIIQEITSDIDSSSIAFKQVTTYVSEGVSVTNAAGDSLDQMLQTFKLTANQTEQIEKLLQQAVKNSQTVLNIAQKNQDMAHTTANATEQIAAASEEQSGSIEEINSNIEVITEFAEETKQHIASVVMDKLMYKKAIEVKQRVEKDKNFDGSVSTMKRLVNELEVDEIDITDSKGVMSFSNIPGAVGLNIFDLMMKNENFDLKKHLFVDKNPYSASALKVSAQTGTLFKFMMIPDYEKQIMYQVALSYESLLKLLN